MHETEYQQVIAELQAVIDETRHTIARFEAAGMDEQMSEDDATLLALLDDAVKQQREHGMAMLGKPQGMLKKHKVSENGNTSSTVDLFSTDRGNGLGATCCCST